jgi:hypothetical protein
MVSMVVRRLKSKEIVTKQKRHEQIANLTNELQMFRAIKSSKRVIVDG